MDGEGQKEDERKEDDGEFPGKRDGNLAAKCVMALVPSRPILVSSRLVLPVGMEKGNGPREPWPRGLL